MTWVNKGFTRLYEVSCKVEFMPNVPSMSRVNPFGIYSPLEGRGVCNISSSKYRLRGILGQEGHAVLDVVYVLYIKRFMPGCEF